MPLLKLCLILAGLASVGSIIGVSVSLSAKGKVDDKSPGGAKLTQVEIGNCSDQLDANWVETNFGVPEDGKICWTVSPGNQSTLGEKEKFTQLFREKWNKSLESWANAHKEGSAWKSTCGSGPSWIITGGQSKEEYLGYCEWEKGDQSLFVKKSKTEKQEGQQELVKLSICQGSCWETGGSDLNTRLPKQLESLQTQEWIEVIFKKEQSREPEKDS